MQSISASGASSGEFGRSEYMHWAKTRQAARFNLAVSGVPAVSFAELGARTEDLEVSGASFYGWPALMEALARHTGVPENHVVHAVGTSMANYLALAVCLEPGDEVLIEEPTYELLVDAARYTRAVVRRFPRPRGLGFQPDPEALRGALTSRTRLVVLTNLHNPSSARLEEATLRHIVDMADRVGARVLVDEVYLDAASGQDGIPRTAHGLDERVLVTSSLTKVYGLSGLRCGWVLATPDLAERMWRLNDLFGVIPAHAAERLSVIALREAGRLRARSLAVLATNRLKWDAFARGRSELESVPLTCGTVTFPRLREGSVDDLCDLLRHRHETTVAPGRFFGVPDSFRVGFGTAPETFAEGLCRLGLALDELRAAPGR